MTSEDAPSDPIALIDEYAAKHDDWRGQTFARLRELILTTEPGIVQQWKWMGTPTFELDGILCVLNIFKSKLNASFMWGAHLPDPTGLFNAELGGNQRRAIDFFEGAPIDEDAFHGLIRAAIDFNRAKRAAKAKK